MTQAVSQLAEQATLRLTERASRYGGVVPPSALGQAHAAVVGVGAIGRQLALQLGIMGVATLTLVDHDTVETGNLGCQGWSEAHLGIAKVRALEDDLLMLNADTTIHAFDQKFEDVPAVGEAKIIASCVDNMEVRKAIFEMAREQGAFFVEARMGAEVCEVRSAYSQDTAEEWLKAWYPSKDASPLPCAQRSTFYMAASAASLMTSMIVRHLAQRPVPVMVRLDLEGIGFDAALPEAPQESLSD